MPQSIITFNDLLLAVEKDATGSPYKEIATLLLNAMTDWRIPNERLIQAYRKELSSYYNNSVTIERIKAKKINIHCIHDSSRQESGWEIAIMMIVAKKHGIGNSFEVIMKNILNHYSKL